MLYKIPLRLMVRKCVDIFTLNFPSKIFVRFIVQEIRYIILWNITTLQTGVREKKGRLWRHTAGVVGSNSHISSTHLAHLDLTVCLVQNPAHYHAYKVWPEASPWLVVDLIEHGQWIIHTTTSNILTGNQQWAAYLSFSIPCSGLWEDLYWKLFGNLI